MRLAVVTLGSAGDLHPYLAIAREMHCRGHGVDFFSQEPHRAVVEAEGLRFTAIASARDHDRTLRHPLLWHPVRGFGVLWRHLCVPAIQPTFDALAALEDAGPSPLTVFASPLAVGARLLRETRPGLRLVSGYTAPSALRSCRDPMFLGAWRVPRWFPVALRQALWRGLDAWKLEPMARVALCHHRARWSLGPQAGSTFGEWIHSPDGGVALFPSWFTEPALDWPVHPAFAGFPVYEPGAAPVPMDTRLSDFLASGSPPVVVIPGSAAFAGHGFLDRAASAARNLDRRCVLLSAYDQRPGLDEQDVLRLAGAQLSELLPRAAAVIHHGGIGTCAQGLAARIPQLILPAAYDQFDNGYRVAQVGCGLSVAGWAASGAETRRQETLVRALEAVLRLDSQGAVVGTVSPVDTVSAGLRWPVPSFRGRPNAAVDRACEILVA